MSDFYDARRLAQERALGAEPPEELLRDRYDGLMIRGESPSGIALEAEVPWEDVDHGSDYTVKMDFATGGLDAFIDENLEVTIE